MKLLQRFLALVCLILLFVFCISNRELMTVRFLNWNSPELPVFLLLVFAFLAGAVLALLWQSLRSVTRPKDKPSRKAGKTPEKSADPTEAELPSKTTPGDTDSDTVQPESPVVKYEGEN